MVCSRYGGKDIPMGLHCSELGKEGELNLKKVSLL
jgi:hypothetical protein